MVRLEARSDNNKNVIVGVVKEISSEFALQHVESIGSEATWSNVGHVTSAACTGSGVCWISCDRNLVCFGFDLLHFVLMILPALRPTYSRRLFIFRVSLF